MGCGASSEGAVRPDQYGQHPQYGHQQGYGQQPYGQQPNGQPQYGQHQQQYGQATSYPQSTPPVVTVTNGDSKSGSDLPINKPLAVQTWLEEQVQGKEEEELWSQLKAAGYNTWASINRAMPSDATDNVAALIKACPGFSKPGLAQALLAKAALEVRAAGVTNKSADASRTGAAAMGYPQQPGGYPQQQQYGGYPQQQNPYGVPGYPQQQPAYPPYGAPGYPQQPPPYGGGYPQQQQQQQQGGMGGGMGMGGGLALGAGAGLLGGALLGSAFGGMGGHDTTIINNYEQPQGGDYGGGGDFGGGDFGGGDFGGGDW